MVRRGVCQRRCRRLRRISRSWQPNTGCEDRFHHWWLRGSKSQRLHFECGIRTAVERALHYPLRERRLLKRELWFPGFLWERHMATLSDTTVRKWRIWGRGVCDNHKYVSNTHRLSMTESIW